MKGLILAMAVMASVSLIWIACHVVLLPPRLHAWIYAKLVRRGSARFPWKVAIFPVVVPVLLFLFFMFAHLLTDDSWGDIENEVRNSFLRITETAYLLGLFLSCLAVVLWSSGGLVRGLRDRSSDSHTGEGTAPFETVPRRRFQSILYLTPLLVLCWPGVVSKMLLLIGLEHPFVQDGNVAAISLLLSFVIAGSIVLLTNEHVLIRSMRTEPSTVDSAARIVLGTLSGGYCVWSFVYSAGYVWKMPSP